MKSFIRAAEIWLPAQDHSLLEFGAGLFGDALSFGALSQTMCFGRADGLPGEAWGKGHPVLLKHFEGSDFRRIGAADVAGLTCAVALPFFKAGEVSAVAVLFGGDDESSKGAIELWRNDPRISSDITLLDGYYGGLPPEFEQLSRDAYLPRGMGLPGMAWQRDESVMLGQADASTSFLRGNAASDAGICRALAWPCQSMTNASYVLMLLSGTATPVARRMERWVVDAASGSLVLAGGYCETEGELPGASAAFSVEEADPLIRQLLSDGTPVLSETAQSMSGVIGRAAVKAGVQGCLCLPVVVEDKVTEFVALYL
ncbi:MAG: GAF domain-containing protein [Aquabacterium sp.]|uniref:hypothetical protein n=1 Tax=Aquabacterium sp. TaxID=1872578 RepID=UPI0025BA4D4D|nr:hypothetical protein [Aquabacterium sp.]MBI5924147.1 GAF domain-containing protein [Aquabacterium sp.]